MKGPLAVFCHSCGKAADISIQADRFDAFDGTNVRHEFLILCPSCFTVLQEAVQEVPDTASVKRVQTKITVVELLDDLMKVRTNEGILKNFREVLLMVDTLHERARKEGYPCWSKETEDALSALIDFCVNYCGKDELPEVWGAN